jgi:hypothetical protein
MRYDRILAMALAAAGALLAAACRDDAEALSKPEFIAQGNAICEASIAEVDPLFEAVFDKDAGFDPDDPASEELIFVPRGRAGSQSDARQQRVMRRLGRLGVWMNATNWSIWSSSAKEGSAPASRTAMSRPSNWANSASAAPAPPVVTFGTEGRGPARASRRR